LQSAETEIAPTRPIIYFPQKNLKTPAKSIVKPLNHLTPTKQAGSPWQSSSPHFAKMEPERKTGTPGKFPGLFLLPINRFLLNTLDFNSFSLNTLQLRSKAKSIGMNTLRNKLGGGVPSSPNHSQTQYT
jgi:hypothetical protein